MAILELKSKIVTEFRKSLNPKSKFYKEDLQKFINNINGEIDVSKLQDRLNNLICLNGGNRAFNEEVSKIIIELDKAGMFILKPKK